MFQEYDNFYSVFPGYYAVEHEFLIFKDLKSAPSLIYLHRTN